jgi:hypothetical protein
MVSPSVGWGAAALDHGIALNERHLKRLLAEYVSYPYEDRTHLGLGKETVPAENSGWPSKVSSSAHVRMLHAPVLGPQLNFDTDLADSLAPRLR